jgi:hypothetical protein
VTSRSFFGTGLSEDVEVEAIVYSDEEESAAPEKMNPLLPVLEMSSTTGVPPTTAESWPESEMHDPPIHQLLANDAALP